MLDIVNDLLDISKIEAGEMDLDFASVGLNEAISEAVALVQPQANSQRVIIRTALSQSVPDVVADLRSIKQIALNILSNAIRFTPSGGQIVVSTSYEANGSVAMRIRDTGIGMTRSELDQAMKPFRQVVDAIAPSRRRHRPRPAADQGNGRRQPGDLLDQLCAERRHAGGNHLPVAAGAGGLSLFLRNSGRKTTGHFCWNYSPKKRQPMAAFEVGAGKTRA